MILTRVRVRQHVNPLAQPYLTPTMMPTWERIYAHLNQPLHLDIGCAKGKFLLKMAALYPQRNFLGVEIRQSLVVEANADRDRLGLSNLHFLFCNINSTIVPLLESLPPMVLQWATVQFPDPWFKNRHAKRRVVQTEVVDALAKYLIEGGEVFLQSDVQAVATEMSDRFLHSPHFQKLHQDEWFDENPFSVSTEREISTLKQNKPVYRLFLKKVEFMHN